MGLGGHRGPVRLGHAAIAQAQRQAEPLAERDRAGARRPEVCGGEADRRGFFRARGDVGGAPMREDQRVGDAVGQGEARAERMGERLPRGVFAGPERIPQQQPARANLPRASTSAPCSAARFRWRSTRATPWIA